jgi:hypothetical protein
MRRKIWKLGLALGLLVLILGCDKKVYYHGYDDVAPSRPKGLYSITGDEAVYLYWEENDERDLKGYVVYRSREENGQYKPVATVNGAEYVDDDVRNGVTYWYGITAFDYDDNESDLSYVTYDTPRPEGWDEIIHAYNVPPWVSVSGFDFSQGEVVPWDVARTDIFLEYDNDYGVFFLWAADYQTDIQDFGYTDDIDDVDMAPDVDEGWSKLGWVEVIKGHTCLVWTRDDHYAKLRVYGFTRSYGIFFDWAWQIAPGNPELKIRPPREEREIKTELNIARKEYVEANKNTGVKK